MRPFFRELLLGDVHVPPCPDMATRLDRAVREGNVVFGGCWCDDDPFCPVSQEVHKAADRHGLTLAVSGDQWELRR